MRHSNRRKQNKIKNIKRARVTVLFIVVAIIVVMGSAIIAQKFSASKQSVQALDNNANQDKNQDSNGSEVKSEVPSKDLSKESSSEVEDVAFVENYLNQQMKNKKPDGADGKKVVYLTFDDGPSETVTPQILDILKSENVHATFFLVGKAINESDTTKNLVKRELADGNAIGNHTYSHNYTYLYPNGKINLENCMSDFEKTNQILKDVLGQDFSTRAVRFPGGQMTWGKKDPKGVEKMDAALHDKDYHQVDWNALSGDAEEGGPKNAAQLTQELIKTVTGREKAVILMHDTYGKEETAKALPGIIKYLKDQGYEFKIMK
ncbi:MULTISPECIES: polysaccharide deacetylase family protein [unclassified Clostridium]|uniref:polysaccharide deacetylase family protein n=1 Tax=unclassified Clostridium TaxID=2614128 RepID=UPI000297727F|nr:MULTISPECIES: polysaccharide deacetylase family protein [unclassified Clostridium]EKQ50888.1 MAG: putative xylanase/chitin deacetylase [Clostridium sp. Maddingley MBC34-26]